jgi:hypothetical protein
MTLDSAEALCAVLGLELAQTRGPWLMNRPGRSARTALSCRVSDPQVGQENPARECNPLRSFAAPALGRPGKRPGVA